MVNFWQKNRPGAMPLALSYSSYILVFISCRNITPTMSIKGTGSGKKVVPKIISPKVITNCILNLSSKGQA